MSATQGVALGMAFVACPRAPVAAVTAEKRMNLIGARSLSGTHLTKLSHCARMCARHSITFYLKSKNKPSSEF